MLDLPEGIWEIVPFERHKAADKYVESLDRAEAEDFLRQYKSDSTILLDLRELLGRIEPVYRMTDDQVIDQIASRLASRQMLLRVTARSPKDDSSGSGESTEQSISTPDSSSSGSATDTEEF
jgi:hypothetical protein